MNISGIYKTQHGDLIITQNGDKISATYQENGTCSGKLSSNKVEGIWKNKKDEGLFEWIFDGKGGFSGKYKTGTDAGPMRGRWNGNLKTSDESPSENSEEKEITIEISGRIPKYFFGSVKEEYRDELKDVPEYCSEEISTVEDFLRMLLKMTLEDKETAREDFFCYVEASDLEDNFPNLDRLIKEIEENEYDHFALYDALFDTADYWEGGTGFITFFETDAEIRILSDNKELVEKQKLETFFKSVISGSTEDGPADEMVELFMERNAEQWGLSESLGFSKNKLGCYHIEDWFSPLKLLDLSESEHQVTIEHDDIITYTFNIFTRDFRFEDLLFLGHSNYADFRGSSCDTLFNYLFYKNEIVSPDESWMRDKGITLTFDPKFQGLSFLLNG